jgi:hypothetical protein
MMVQKGFYLRFFKKKWDNWDSSLKSQSSTQKGGPNLSHFGRFCPTSGLFVPLSKVVAESSEIAWH